MNDDNLYDKQLAEGYDAMMSDDRFNSLDRKKFHDLIETNIPITHFVIDLGGGTGTDAIILAKKGYKVCIIEPSEEMLSQAKDKIQELELTEIIDCMLGDASCLENINFPKNTPVSIVSNFAAINHLTDPKRDFVMIQKAVRCGGRFIFSVGNPFYYLNFFRPAVILKMWASFFSSGTAGNPVIAENYYYYTKKNLVLSLSPLKFQKRYLSVGRLPENFAESWFGTALKLLRFAPFIMPSSSAFQLYVFHRECVVRIE